LAELEVPGAARIADLLACGEVLPRLAIAGLGVHCSRPYLCRRARPTVLLMAGRAHPGVDAYIERLPEWQQRICSSLREIVWAADPDIEETIKRSVQPYFVLDGNVCALLATKDHVNLFLYDPTVPDPHGIINQGHGNATARAIQVYDGDAIDEPALTELLQAIVANNRAGGWRRLSGRT
jgi:hypothetical protein